jgi:hypothetical protein
VIFHSYVELPEGKFVATSGSGYMKCSLLTGGRAPFRVAASACCDLVAG